VVIRASEELESVYRYVNNYSKKSSLIAEEFIYGDEYCVEVIVADRNPFVVAVTQKAVTSDKYCIELAAITPAPISENLNKKIKEYISSIVSKFDISNTVLHIEIKVTGNQIKIVEINPRPAGGGIIENIYNLKGLNIYDYAFDIAFKRKLDLKKLESDIRRPFEKFAVFYPFINPVRSGIIKSIDGIDKVKDLFTSDFERLILLCDQGQFLPEPKTNEEARGYIYLMDQDYDKLLSRLYTMENLLEFKFAE
jgi:biotin carboxylase